MRSVAIHSTGQIFMIFYCTIFQNTHKMRKISNFHTFERSWSGFFAAQQFKLWASRRVWSGLFDVMNSYGQWNEELTYKKWHLVLFMDAWASFAKSLFVIYWMDQANHTAIYRRFFNNPSYKIFHTSYEIFLISIHM